MKQIGLVILGWVLGLLSNPITEWIRRRRLKKSLAAAFGAEVLDVKYRSVMAYAYLLSFTGGGRSEIKWTIDKISAGTREEYRGVHASFSQLVTRSDQEIADVMLTRRMQTQNKGVSLRRLDLPFLGAQLHQLDILDVRIQEQLLQLRTEVQIYNEIIEEVQRLNAMTFETAITGGNREIVIENISKAEIGAAQRLRIIGDRCEELLPRLKNLQELFPRLKNFFTPRDR